MTIALGYARVSTGEQAKGFSLDAQFKEIDTYCHQQGITLLERFNDSMSGRKLTERLGLMSMLQQVDVIKPRYVIATEVDRISRNTLQYGWIDTHLSMKGVKLLLLNETEGEDPAAKAFHRIRVVFSEFETELRQWRIDRGRVLAKANHRFMNRPPFGYRMQGKNIIPEPELMPVVVRIFDDYLHGIPVRRIAREVEKSPASVRYVLRNRFYVDGKLNGTHDVLISAEKFQQVQERLHASKECHDHRVATKRNI